MEWRSHWSREIPQKLSAALRHLHHFFRWPSAGDFENERAVESHVVQLFEQRLPRDAAVARCELVVVTAPAIICRMADTQQIVPLRIGILPGLERIVQSAKREVANGSSERVT